MQSELTRREPHPAPPARTLALDCALCPSAPPFPGDLPDDPRTTPRGCPCRVARPPPLPPRPKPEHGDEVFQPSVGQPGKDVIWVPTPDALVTRMLTAAKVTKDDLVYDLGSGDGKIPIAAAKQFGATGRRHRVQPGHGRARAPQRQAPGRRQHGEDHHRRHLQGGLQQGDRRHDVPAAGPQPEAASDDPQDEARHARDVAPVPHGRLGSGREVQHRVPRCVPVVRAGAGRGDVDVQGRGRQQSPKARSRWSSATSASAER